MIISEPIEERAMKDTLMGLTLDHATIVNTAVMGHVWITIFELWVEATMSINAGLYGLELLMNY